MSVENRLNNMDINMCNLLVMLKHSNLYSTFSSKFYDPIAEIYKFSKRSTQRRDSTMQKLYKIYLKDPKNFVLYLYITYPSATRILNTYFQ